MNRVRVLPLRFISIDQISVIEKNLCLCDCKPDMSVTKCNESTSTRVLDLQSNAVGEALL